MSRILRELYRACQREDGSEDHRKGSQLLELYALEIQMFTVTRNNRKLRVRLLSSVETLTVGPVGAV